MDAVFFIFTNQKFGKVGDVLVKALKNFAYFLIIIINLIN